ncbi:MAG: hypothetical protein JEZ12_21670 [Desulfobacterium sp.]|nr:hypothetical protein [Desulfobacterium sp.]
MIIEILLFNYEGFGVSLELRYRILKTGKTNILICKNRNRSLIEEGITCRKEIKMWS